MRFPSSHRWTLCITPKSPKGGSKRELLHLALPFISSLQVTVDILNLVCGLNIASPSIPMTYRPCNGCLLAACRRQSAYVLPRQLFRPPIGRRSWRPVCFANGLYLFYFFCIFLAMNLLRLWSDWQSMSMIDGYITSFLKHAPEKPGCKRYKVHSYVVFLSLYW